MSNSNLKIECDFSDPGKLPAQLVIRNGRVVVTETGEAPLFPAVFANGTTSEGQHVSVVPTADLRRMQRLLEIIRNLTT